MLAINEVLQQGRYRIINQFRQNGRGSVYEAFDNVLETNVLLKENSGNSKKVITVSQMESRKLAFADEAKALKEIKHESLLHVRDYFSEIDRQYLVLEYADGNDLSELLKKDGSSFALSDVASWADQLLNALNYLHTHAPPVIHREINPQNLRLTSNGKIKLLAFDLIKNTGAKVNAPIPNQILNYLPLEQIWDGLDSGTQRVITNSYDERSMRVLEQPLDARSDIYALGATLYHLLTAQVPIDALERSIDILEGKSDPLPIPHKLNPNIPPEISEVLMKSMEIKRENRFFSAVIMRQVLRTAFVRVKEREAQNGEKEEEVLELPTVENQELEVERRLAEQKRLQAEAEQKQIQAEAEQKRQMELVRQQLLEAKAKNLKEEQLAAEAEKQRVEKELKDLNDKKSLATTKSSAKIHVQTSSPPNIPTNLIKESVAPHIPTKPIKEIIAPEHSFVESNVLFAEASKAKKVNWLIPAVAVVLLLIGGGIFGVLMLPASGNSGMNQAISDVPASATETAKPQPTAEIVPVLSVESTPEINAVPTPDSSKALAEEKQVSQPTVKTKPTPSRVEKPTPQPAKTPKPQKTLTVEDLIDN